MLVAILVFGSGAALSAVAQTPPLSLPPLPGKPSAAPKADKPSVALPDINNSSAPKVDSASVAAPKPSAAPVAGVTGEQVPNDLIGKPVAPPLPTVPKVPPSDDSAGFGKQAADGTTVLPNVVVQATKTPDLPGLVAPAPDLISKTKGKDAAESKEAAPVEVLADQDSSDEAPKRKSWETKLAPSVKIPKLGYHYKHQILPDLVYRDEYTHDNMHLPSRMTREDYGALLFTSIAKSDLEVTRALLNAGTPTSTTNQYGETPLDFAARLGDERVVALLTARGAR